MGTISFDINDALKHYMSDPATIPTPEADAALFDCENDPEALTNQVINPVLNPIIDAVADNPDAILRAVNIDSLQFLLKYDSQDTLCEDDTRTRYGGRGGEIVNLLLTDGSTTDIPPIYQLTSSAKCSTW